MGISMVLQNDNITDDTQNNKDEVHDTQQSTEIVKESSVVTSETQPTHDKKLDKIDFNTLFLAISFAGLLIEAASAIFNLVSTYVYVPERIKHIVATAFYAISIIVSLSMMASSILAIKQSLNSKKKLQETSTGPNKEAERSINEGLLGYDKLKQKQANIQISENTITIISEILWIIVSAASLVMITVGTGTPALELASLCLAVIAPFLAFISCALRLSDANISRKTATSNKEKRHASNFTVLCTIILLFEAIHCGCHVAEAVMLGGKMQNIYDFQDAIVLGLELAAVVMFIAAFFIEKYLDKKAEKSDPQATPSSLLDDKAIDRMFREAQIS